MATISSTTHRRRSVSGPWRAVLVRLVAVLVLLTSVLPAQGWASDAVVLSASPASLGQLAGPDMPPDDDPSGGLPQHCATCLCDTAVRPPAAALPGPELLVTASFAWNADGAPTSHPHVLPFKPPRA
jgi:hypothetical protein